MSTEADAGGPAPGIPEAPLLRELDGRVLVLTLNRPQRLNALTPELHAQLREAVEHAAHDPEVGALVSPDQATHSVRAVTWAAGISPRHP